MINLIVGDGKIAPGSCYLSDTPALAQHHGSQPDLLLSWTAIDLAARSVDVILYFHGFAVSGEKQALLSDFVKVSGLDLMKGARFCRPQKTDHRHRPAWQCQPGSIPVHALLALPFSGAVRRRRRQAHFRRAGGLRVCKKTTGRP